MKCTGTDCAGCEAARQHYRATGCLDPECTRDHGEVKVDAEANGT